MNKIAQSLIAATAAIFLLAGCAAGSAEAQDAPEVSVTPSASVAPSESSAPAPITMSEAPEAPKSAAQEAGFKDADDMFLRSVKMVWQGEVPADNLLLSAGAYACDELHAGANRKSLVAVEGDPRNNLGVVDYAVQAYCPEFDG